MRAYSNRIASPMAPRNVEVARVTVRFIRGLEGRQLVVRIRVDVLPIGEHCRHGSRFPYAPPPRRGPLVFNNRSNRRLRVLAPPYRRRLFVHPRRGWSLSIKVRESSVIQTTHKSYLAKHVQVERLHSATGSKRPNLRHSLLHSGGLHILRTRC